MRYFLGILFIASILLTSCAVEQEKRRTETLEIFNTKGNASDKSIDSLRFFESTEYLGDDKIATSYFDNLGQLTGKESISYNDNGIPLEGRFFDPSGKLLSYYDYITNTQGDVIAEYGFDASNDNLLSIKAYEYDLNGRVVSRKVFEGDYTLYREYDFKFDQYGNETSMTVLNNAGESVFVEAFMIVKHDSSKQWTEKWGFVNDEPVTFYKRS